MSLQPPPDDIQICPSCKATNHPNVVVCASCGVRLDTFGEVNEEWQARQTRETEDHRKVIQAEAEETVRQAAVQGRLHRNRSLVILGIVLAVLVVVVWIVTSLIRGAELARQAALQAGLDKAATCRKAEDLICARNSLADVYRSDPTFADVGQRLADARLELANQYLVNGQTVQALEELNAALVLRPGDPAILNRVFAAQLLLANQYANSNRWEDALKTLEEALRIRPGDAQALDQLKLTYDRWAIQQQSSGNLIKALLIRIQRNARFPGQ